MEISPTLSLTPSHSDCVLASMHSLEIMTSFCPLFVRMTITSEPTTFCPSLTVSMVHGLYSHAHTHTLAVFLSFTDSLTHSLTHRQANMEMHAHATHASMHTYAHTFPIFSSPLSLSFLRRFISMAIHHAVPGCRQTNETG